MAIENSEPPMTWRYCGNQVKLWRTQAQVSREALAKEADYAAEYVKSMEQGRRKPTIHLLRVADQLCGARGLLTAGEEYLQPEKFVSYSADYMLYELDAVALYFYQASLVPGLLQTEAYARHLITGHWPPLDEETIDRRVAGRMERQALLSKDTVSFSFVISERVLRLAYGGGALHKAQLARMLEVGEQRNVDVQVLLDRDMVNPGLHGPFVLLSTEQHEHLAYVEMHGGGVIYAEAEKVDGLRQRYEKLLQQALSPRDSTDFIAKLMGDL
ncbi:MULTISPECIES: helix-turn-helix domain-containing protein [Streptomyces]|uniref:helix-turn-helix domain-containing protein n=1 Tax=Streptomyces TaxID=1883 RepID=UPI00067B8971|nr:MULTISPECIES: helix-turn-helix transcriptional regulator [Streptomyces]KOT53697.1 DNA-binding protein [Streptomyces rimosus subsp. rimosus]